MTSLSWGDARLENMIFGDDLRCEGILEWEMASLGGPLLDLGWWLFCDEFGVLNAQGPRLTGFGGREETIARWTECTGIATDELAWYEIFAGYRMSATIMRMMRMWLDEFGLTLPENFDDLDNAGSRLLSRLLSEA